MSKFNSRPSRPLAPVGRAQNYAPAGEAQPTITLGVSLDGAPLPAGSTVGIRTTSVGGGITFFSPLSPSTRPHSDWSDADFTWYDLQTSDSTYDLQIVADGWTHIVRDQPRSDFDTFARLPLVKRSDLTVRNAPAGASIIVNGDNVGGIRSSADPTALFAPDLRPVDAMVRVAVPGAPNRSASVDLSRGDTVLNYAEMAEDGAALVQRWITIENFPADVPEIRVTSGELGAPVRPWDNPTLLQLPIVFRGAPSRVTLDIAASSIRPAVRQVVDLTSGDARFKYGDMPNAAGAAFTPGIGTAPVLTGGGGTSLVSPPTPRFTVVGSTGVTGRTTPYSAGTLRIWHMPEWGQVFLNDMLTPGSWEGGSPASGYYSVPISLASNTVRVVAPNGEVRQGAAVPSTAQPVVTLDYLTMIPSRAAGAPSGEVRIIGIPRGATLKIDGADVTSLPAARWTDAITYGVPSPTGGHSIVVRAPNGEERQSTYTLSDAATPVSLNYGEMRQTRAADGAGGSPYTGGGAGTGAGTGSGGAGASGGGSTPSSDGQTTVRLTGIPNTPTLRAFLLTAGEVSGANALDAINGTPGAWVTKFRTPGAIEFRTGLGGDVRDAIPTTGGTYEVRVIEGTTTPAGDPVLDGWRGFRTVMSSPVTVATGQTASVAYVPSASSGLATTRGVNGPGSIRITGVPAGIPANFVSAIPTAGGAGVYFVPSRENGAFDADGLAPGQWRIQVMVSAPITGSPGPNSRGVPADIRTALVTVRAGESVAVSFRSLVPDTGTPVVDPNDRGMVVAGSVPLYITAPDTFLVTVDGATVSPNLIQSSGGIIPDGHAVAPTGAFTQRQTMVAPGVHRVVVRDPSAAACYSDTQDITIAPNVPASMDYTAPITSALQACAARQGQSAGGWSGLSAPAKMGVVGLGLAAVGGALWWFAESNMSKSSRSESDE